MKRQEVLCPGKEGVSECTFRLMDRQVQQETKLLEGGYMEWPQAECTVLHREPEYVMKLAVWLSVEPSFSQDVTLSVVSQVESLRLFRTPCVVRRKFRTVRYFESFLWFRRKRWFLFFFSSRGPNLL